MYTMKHIHHVILESLLKEYTTGKIRRWQYATLVMDVLYSYETKEEEETIVWDD